MLEQYIRFTYFTITTHRVFFIELTLAIIITLTGLYLLKKPQSAPATAVTPPPRLDVPKKSPLIITSHDIKAIAGDDIITTQLDLARAYIEIGKKKLAKKILDHVSRHGNSNQQHAAQALMMNL